MSNFSSNHSARTGTGFSAALLAIAMTACASTVPSSISIAQARAVPDDTKVVVIGELVQQIDQQHYLPRDNSGQITARIDKDTLGEVKIAPDARLRIDGEIDQGHNPPQLKAKAVQRVR